MKFYDLSLTWGEFDSLRYDFTHSSDVEKDLRKWADGLCARADIVRKIAALFADGEVDLAVDFMGGDSAWPASLQILADASSLRTLDELAEAGWLWTDDDCDTDEDGSELESESVTPPQTTPITMQ